MSSIPNTSSAAGNVAALDMTVKGESLWRQSFKRLIRNRLAILGLIIILFFVFIAIFAEQIAPMSYRTQTLGDANTAPLWVTRLFPTMKPADEGGYIKINESYALGADNLGRDLMSRIIYGTRVSLMVALIGPLVAILIGVILGLTAGYFGGAVDNFIMRVTDVMYAFPTLLLIILLMAFFRPTTGQLDPASFAYAINQIDVSSGGMFFIFVGIGVTSWMQMARLTRGLVLAQREQDYVLAAESLGASRLSITVRHILPNILGPLIVAETLTIPRYISYEAFLSFIGLGVNPPTPSWGAMIAEGSQSIRSYPNQAIFPALALFFIMFAFNFLGDGLRDAFDPRMKGTN